MKTIKVSEATNTQLDWLVAKCEGEYVRVWTKPVRVEVYHPNTEWGFFTPTTNWFQMGPIIDFIDGVLMKRWAEANRDGKCQVEIHNPDGDWIAFGPTLCVAAARCYVASKLGDTVEVPEELT